MVQTALDVTAYVEVASVKSEAPTYDTIKQYKGDIMNAALVVKTPDGNWEVVEKYNIKNEVKLNTFLTAYESESPIVGMITTSYQDSAVPGATWNGSSFSGGTKPPYMDGTDVDWSVITTYALLSNNVIIFLFNTVNNDPKDAKMKAAFESEVTMVPITVGNVPRLGDIWNGQQFITKA